MLGMIPLSESKLRADLEMEQAENLYMAPEDQDHAPVGKALQYHLKGRNDPWVELLLKLWRNEPWPTQVYIMDDCEWWAGTSLEEVKDAYLRNFEEKDRAEYEEGIRVLTDAELDSLIFRDVAELDEEGEPKTRTFRAEPVRLLDSGVELPCSFACTES